jgi:hypothetical protein
MLHAFAPAVLITLVMSVIYIMPPFREVESAMDLELGSFIGDWETRTYPPSEAELKILAKDTQFAKAHCTARRLEEASFIQGTAPLDRVDLSIVLSGHDLANSIHRPERCMPAQGHRALQGQSSTLELPSGRTLPVTRLLSQQDVTYGPPDDRQHTTQNCLTYYFFVGERRVTESHLERTLLDIRDRILYGKAQRWAYVSATMAYVPEDQRSFGGPPTLEIAEDKIRDLLAELAARSIDWERVSL